MERSEARRVLGLPVDCTTAEVEAAFRRHALRTHPDRGGDRAAFEAGAEARRALLAPPAPGPPVLFVHRHRTWIRVAARLWARWASHLDG